MIIKNKKILSWAMYDWANSAFATTIMAGFFPVFFKSYWSAGTDPLVTTARLGMAISIVSFIMAMLSPLMGALADMRGLKKEFCLFFMVIGALASAGLGFIDSGLWLPAIFIYGIGMMCFNATAVFYDSLLPSVAQGKEMNVASSLGYSLGYLGGGVLFAINVAMYLKPSIFGLSDGVAAVKASFISVGIWWVLFSLPLILNVREEKTGRSSSEGLVHNLIASLRQLLATIKELPLQKNLALFLVAYWLYIDGVYTVMTMAVDFGLTIGLESKDLISALLLTQFVGFPAALGAGYLANYFGTKKMILTCVATYVLVVGFATQMNQAWHFYFLAASIGLVQGGVQGLSRSLYGRMIPAERSAEYFGLFNLIGKFASIAGPLVVAIGVTVTRDPRLGMASLIILFVMGAALLSLVREPQEQ